MVIERYSDLLMFTSPEYGVPETFFSQDETAGNSCIFLVSCLAADRITYMDNSCEEITGYPADNFIKGGMDFWFPLIHPEDLPLFTEKIIKAHKELFKPGFTKEQLTPLVFEYRFKRPDGEWWKMRDTKYMLFPGNEVVIDKILCRFELISKNEENVKDVEDVLRKEKSCNKMLEFAMVFNNEHAKQANPSTAPQLTKREKEILLLIGEGLSTKMIADKCQISVNTVETHRRHLLEKLHARNSMELIKEASKVFWL